MLWIAGVGLAGFFIGGTLAGPAGSALGLIWGGSIGYGFGSIFDQTLATKLIVVYWAATMALVGPIFSLQASAEIFTNPTIDQDISAAAIGAAAGALFGSLIGIIQIRRREHGSG
jgi:hypothetical protein